MGVKHPELVLAAAVACCLPMVPNLLAGNVTPTTAGERFLVALVVCWVLGSVLSYVIRTYTAQAHRSQLMRLLDVEQRRQTQDEPPAPE